MAYAIAENIHRLEGEIGGVFTDSRQFLVAASVIAAGSVASKVLGFVRESCLAAVFGASAATDAYLVASTVPNLIVGVVVGAVATTFVPVYTQERQRNTRAAGRLAGNVLVVMALVGAGAGGVVALGARPLCSWLAPEFPPATLELAARTALRLAPLPVLLGLNALGTSLLQAHYRFSLPVLGGVCQNLVLIAAILTLGRGWGITGVAVGLVAGTAAQWLALGPGMRGLGIVRSGAFWRDTGVRRILGLALPLIGGGLLGQVAPVAQRVLASGLPEGSLSALNYATLLFGLPTGLTVTALGTVLYPAFSGRSAQGDLEGVRSLLRRGINLSVLLILPVTVGCLLLSVPLVRLAFERGAFDAGDTAATAAAFWFLAWSMLPSVCNDLWRRVFYALQDTGYPTLVGMASMVITVGASFLSVGHLAQAGLALAVTLGHVASAVLLFCRLRARLGYLGGRQLLDRALKAGVASAGMGLLVVLGNQGSSRWLAARHLSAAAGVELIRLGLLMGGAALAYLFLLWLLRVPEVRVAVDLARRATRLRSRLVS